MIAFDGIFYQIKADGLAYPVDDTQKTPFAVVQFFQPDFNDELEREMEYGQLRDYLNATLPAGNLFYAIRIDGFFTQVKVRSVPGQTPPYQPLEEVLKTQAVFELSNVEGTLAGFRFPDYAGGINEPGYHLHFITREHKKGGHVCELRLKKGEVAVEHTSNFYMELPGNGNIPDNDTIKEREK
jgi:acetolactate decarboxylase